MGYMLYKHLVLKHALRGSNVNAMLFAFGGGVSSFSLCITE
jgi:hypothetical protein